ncbi:hypothetical protein LCGC14_0916090 [marine sediment metagenome]|uniref:Uncharacterized protein n=1 Tax=marine sediment metagenome TaxID=412755 RepID=A0A0F9RYY7_9ZZZZ
MRKAFDGANEYTDRMTRLTGQYIDPYTVVPDHRTAVEKFEETCTRWDRLTAKIEKRIGKAKPIEPLVLKPAIPLSKRKPLKMVNGRFVWEPSQKQERSRARQKHQEKI